MRELKTGKLDYLTEEEIEDFYELFFGNILVKKRGFSYYDNLSKSLQRESLVQGVIERLNENEINILKILSTNTFISYDFLIEKLKIILDIPNSIINKTILTLIEKKYIFLRKNNTLVTPNIYFAENFKKIEYESIKIQKEEFFPSKILTNINNLLNYFISKETGLSNSYTLYKKDMESLKEIFSKYSTLNSIEYNIIAYFYYFNFKNNEGQIYQENLKKYYNLSPLDKIFFLIKTVFPWFNSILLYFYNNDINGKISIEQLKRLYTLSFLITKYNYTPIDIDFDKMLQFFNDLKIINVEEDNVIISIYENKSYISKDEVKLTSSFNLYINADSTKDNFYMPALFADFIKFNKIIEYEIKELSIKKAVFNGLNIEDIFDYFENLNIKLSVNVEKTIRLWFEKYSSYYYATGTIFFCNTHEKGKIINSLIANNMVKAFEIEKNKVFLIPEESREDFFKFLDKSGIDYYQKNPYKQLKNKDIIILDLSGILQKKS